MLAKGKASFAFLIDLVRDDLTRPKGSMVYCSHAQIQDGGR